ncbi:MAG: hypothetical protein H6642_00150 [Caldilineaceae bacterium]|nr:hypothetical protein [Caldilineaceae bacterium]
MSDNTQPPTDGNDSRNTNHSATQLIDLLAAIAQRAAAEPQRDEQERKAA